LPLPAAYCIRAGGKTAIGQTFRLPLPPPAANAEKSGQKGASHLFSLPFFVAEAGGYQGCPKVDADRPDAKKRRR
jgi:hypothetical protein